MDWFRNIKVQNKLFIVFGALMAMVVMKSAFTVKTINNIEESHKRLLDGPLQRHKYISQAVGELTAIRLYMLSIGYAAEDSAATEIYYERYLKSAGAFIKYTDDYLENLNNDLFLHEDEKETYRAVLYDIQEQFQVEYRNCVNAVNPAVLDKNTHLVNLLINDIITLGDEVTEKLNKLLTLVEETSNEMSGETLAFMHGSKVMVITISVCIFTLALTVSVFMSRAITKPIMTIENAMFEIAGGNLTYPIRSAYRDEMGILSNHIGDMVDTILMLNIADSIQKEKEEQRLRYEEELRKAAMAALEASRMKSIFLANMSHEIRTPMNGIIGFVELALSDVIPPKTKDYLSKIKTSSETLMQIINDILDISKIEAGKIDLENIPFDLHEVFRLCRTITMPKALEKGITLFCYAEPSINKKLMGDPTKLRQVLLNLLSNAVKFTNSGMVKLLSAVIQSSESSVTIYFEVKDSGIGMSAAQIEKIFQPFMQADGSTTRKYGGTGLGLSIAKNIIEIMGGELIVESMIGLGSKFSFQLTFNTIDLPANTTIKENVHERYEKPSFEGEVLICEDNELNQQVIRDHLLRVGLVTVIAVNGKEGVDIVKRRMLNGEKPFDLIMMDIHMPVMDGLEASKKLSEIGNITPIVAITANIMSNDRETYHELGIHDCVPKPFTSQELWACLLKYFEPVRMTVINEAEQSAADEKQREVLIKGFVKDNQTTYQDINKALQAGDIKQAHRLAHTLKGVAGLIGMTMLQEAARNIEKSLTGGKSEITDEQMKILEFELNAALSELGPLVNKPVKEYDYKAEVADEKALDAFSRLDELLSSDSFDCLNMINELETIPGTELLIDQVERFDFAQARETLAGLRKQLGG